MRDRITGAIGVVWGGGILVKYMAEGAPSLGSGAYAAGKAAGLGLGVLLLLMGLYYLLRVKVSAFENSSSRAVQFPLRRH